MNERATLPANLFAVIISTAVEMCVAFKAAAAAEVSNKQPLHPCFKRAQMGFFRTVLNGSIGIFYEAEIEM